MNETAANRKIKKILSYAAVMVNLWIPVKKRTKYELLLFFNHR